VLATLLAGAAALAAERTMGTLRRLLTMPAPKWTILGGKILGRFTLGIIQMAVMVVAGMLVFKVKWGDSPLALAMIAVSFGLAATALGLFLSTLARTEQQAGGFGTLGTFLLAPLGGAWIPMEITPPAFQTLAQIFPTTWAMRGFTDVVVRGQGPEGVLPETLVLLGFAVIFFALGVWRFKYE
jgi:ABC-2 type transport system permease protein